MSAVALWGRGQYLRTAFVLTWLKIKERQASASELFRISKPFCRKGFPFQRVVGMLDISLEIRWKQTNLPMGELRPSELTMIDKEILYMAMRIQNKGIFLSLVSQLDKLARHNRQGSFRTKDRYYQAMKRFCAYLADEYRLQKLTNISGKHLTSYVLWMQENGKSASTIKTDLSAIRFFHDKMSDPKYLLPDNDALAVELERRCFGGTDRTWSITEFNHMLGKALAIDRYDYILAFYLARFAGLRIHECFRIDTATAEQALRENAITIKGKGGKIRTVPINEQIAIAMKEQLKCTKRGHKLLVPDDMHTDRAINQLQFFIMTYRNAIRDADSDRPMTFHGLRHTYAAEKYTQLIRSGTNALDAHFEVSRLLGHERADVTDIYLASLPKEVRHGR